MISSVICELCSDITRRQQTIEAIRNRKDLEVGELIKTRRLPVVIDATSAEHTRSATEWLQDLDGVDFVEVVFVHFEDSPGPTADSDSPV